MKLEETLAEGPLKDDSVDELLPFLFFDVDYFGAQNSIKGDCALDALPGLKPSEDEIHSC